jgi:putative PIN family toxin of toxin-antitoxin system
VIVAVLDTNVLAAGFIGLTKSDSVPGELLRRWRAKQEFTLVVSEPILAELALVFRRPYFTDRLSEQEIDDAFAGLRAGAVIQSITDRVSGAAAHPHDDQILATASSARAPYIVTGDKLLLAQGKFGNARILSPRQFLAVLERNAVA